MTPEVAGAIAAAVRSLREEAVDGLTALVRIPSVTGQEATAQEWMAAAMAQSGLDVDIWTPRLADLKDHPGFSNIAGRDTTGRPNVVGRRAGRGGGRSLILNGHVDVVDPGSPQSWTYDPWSGAVVGDHLYGRGAEDMKAGLLAAVYAAKAVRLAGINQQGDLIIESVIGEEEGGVGTLATLLRGYRADAAVVMEPTGLAIVPAKAGVTLFRIVVEGLRAHAAVRDHGVSAVEKFIPIFQVLRDLEAEVNGEVDNPLFERYTLPLALNIHRVEAGGPESTVPDKLIAEGRYGYLGTSAAVARRRFEDWLARAARADSWLAEHPPRVEWVDGVWDPVEAPPHLTEAFAAAFRSAARREPVVTGKVGASDSRILKNVGGIPTLEFGPGGGNGHAADEYVCLSEYIQAIHVLAAFIVDWCGPAADTPAVR